MKNRPIVIAGNGPSLAHIDYRRLPTDFDVFRSNQFYFEDKYFLGQRITGAFLNPYPLVQQSYTYHLLQQRGEYEIQDIYFVCNTLHDEYEQGKRLAEDFPSIKNCNQYLQAMPQFHKYERFLGMYHRQKFTSVIWMLITALAQGYTEIYIVGLDFYKKGGLDYAFNSSKPNLINISPHFGDETYKNKDHTEKTDVAGLKMAQNIPGVKIYSISEISPVNEYLPLSPIINQAPMEVENKGPNAISDLCIPPALQDAGGGRGVRFFRRYALLSEYEKLKGTIFVRLILDFFIVIFMSFRILKKIIFRRK